MKKYLTVLLSDIAEAKNNRPDIRSVTDDEIMPFELEDFWENNLDAETEKDTTQPAVEPPKARNIREIMGLQAEQFPSADYWSADEAAQLVVALNDLLKHYNLVAAYPNDLPSLMAYSTLVGALERYAPIMPFGDWYMEFCNYDPMQCPFGEAYCDCLKIHSSDLEKTDEEDFYDKMDNPNNILFVHNYCDAWCERCKFSDRCSVSAVSRFTENDNYALELGLWQDDGEKLATAQRWLKAQLSEIKEPLVSPLQEERSIFDKENNEIRRDKHAVAVVQLTKQYSTYLTDWLQTDTIHTLLQTIDNQSDSRHISKKERVLAESLHVVQWYTYFISVKFMRAVDGKIDDEQELFDVHDDFPKDSDGSAKIAIIGAERSLVAWYDLQQIRPEDAPFTLKMMALLQAVIDAGEKEFPDARAFVRPGFDEKD